MKKFTKILTLFSIVSLFAVTSSNAQIVIRARLGRPRGVVTVRPLRPSPRHVWVAEEWTPNGGTYAYRAGYWAVPPRPNQVWVAGRWANRPRGYVWVPGRWR
jgi:WXXGXW repeat (2 copies)